MEGITKMSAQNSGDIYTEEQYWQLEEAALEKHEFVGGRIYQRADTSFGHTAICANILASANARLRNRPHRVFNGDMKIKVEATGDSFYPDATIHTPPARFTGQGDHTLLTPSILFEVTMPATRDFDRQGKMLFYQQIETLTDTVVVDAERVCVEHFSRDSQSEDWRWRLYTKRSEVVRFPRLELELPLEEIYEGLEIIEDWVEAQLARAQQDE